MNQVFKHAKKISYTERYKKRELLMKPFIKKYDNPVIVHAVNTSAAFMRILRSGMLKLPSKHKSPKKCIYVENLLEINNSIFFSLGFVFATSYRFKYNLIFKLNLLEQLTYYKKGVVFHSYKQIIDYWHDHDKAHLDKFEEATPETKAVMSKYYSEFKENNIKKRDIFEFWRVEKILVEYIKKYPKRKYLEELIKKTSKTYISRYPKSAKLARKDSPLGTSSEMIADHDIKLLEDDSFIGFYIPGNIPPGIKKILKSKYSSKILFDGAEIKGIPTIK